MDAGLSPLGLLIRDFFVTTFTHLNSKTRWLVIGSGRSGVSTLQSAFTSNSDIIPDLPETIQKVEARVLHGQAEDVSYSFRTADMRNQPDGRHQYISEILNYPVGVVFVFKTFRVDEKEGVILDDHLQSENEFKKTSDDHIRHEGDYNQLRFLTNAFLYPDTLEKNFPEIFKDAELSSDVRIKFLRKFKPYAPKVLIMAGNFIDITMPHIGKLQPHQADGELREFMMPYMETFEPLTSQWQRFTRKSWFGNEEPPWMVRYLGISARYNYNVRALLQTMKYSTGLFGK